MALSSPHLIPFTIVSTILGVILVLFVVWIVLFSQAITFTFTNNAYCKKHLCLFDTGFEKNQTFKPIHSFENYSPHTAYYCLQMISNVYQAEQEKDFTLPNNFTFLASFRNRFDTSNIGYFLKDDDNKLWIIFRGTLDQKDVEEDVLLTQKSFGKEGSKVHSGFLEIYRGFSSYLMELVRKHNQSSTIIITGHSLGGGLSMLTLYDLSLAFGDQRNVICYTFGCPRVGNTAFVQQLRAMRNICYRIVNTADIFTQVPLPITFRPWKPRDPIYYDHYGKLFSFTDNKSNYTYNHSILTYLKHVFSIYQESVLSGLSPFSQKASY